MMTIQTHPKSAKFLVIRNATPEAIAFTKTLHKDYYRFDSETTITMHASFKSQFERFAAAEAKAATLAVIAPSFEDEDALSVWADANLSTNAYNILFNRYNNPVTTFNRRFAGKTVAEIEERID
jgi:hypothetical protein